MLVSVVIHAYNEEGCLKKTLESVSKLLHPDFDVEVIVVNGGSTDKTAGIAKEAGAKVITVPHICIGFSRQEGLKAARGEVVAYTDADTTVPKDWLTRHLEVLKSPGVAATFGPFKVDDSGGFSLFSFLFNSRSLLIKFLPAFLRVLYTSGQNFVFWRDKANKIGGVDANLKVMEDVDLALRLRHEGKVVYVEDDLVLTSGRRGKEGLGFFIRGIRTALEYFFLSKRGKLETFPDYR